MKTTIRGVLAASILLITSAFQCPAIEGLQLSLQCSNVVLTWPSVDGDMYIIQRRSNLFTNSSWICLTNSYPATSGTNLTVFTDYGIVSNGICDGSSFGPSMSIFTGGGGFDTLNLIQSLGQTSGDLPFPSMPPPPPGFQYSQTSSGLTLAVIDPSTRTGLLSRFGTFATMDDDSGGLPPIPGPAPSTNDPGTNTAFTDTQFYEVVKVGVHLYGITNGMILSGVVPLNVERGLTDTNETIAELYFDDLDDGTLSPTGVSFPSYVDQHRNVLQGTWDTTGLANGTYTIQLGAQLNDMTGLSDHPVTVIVSNAVAWPDDVGWGGAGVYVGAQTTFPNGTWRLYFDDDQGIRHGPLTGPIAADGWCNYPGVAGPGFTVDNSDGQGNQNPSTYYNLVLTVTSQAQDISITVTNTKLIEPPWNNVNTDAICAYMGLYDAQPDGLPFAELFAMVQVAFTSEDPFHFETLGTPEQPFELNSPQDWQTLLFALGGPGQMNTRDFFYFGHGNVDRIGVGGANGLTAALVQTRLGTLRQPNPPAYASRQPYRFVFLDGCLTGKEDTWCLAFGIPPIKTDNATILNHGFRPRSFMGWKREKAISIGNVSGDAFFYTDHANWVGDFFKGWFERNPNTGLGRRGIEEATVYANQPPNGNANSAGGGLRLLGSKDMIIDY